jgi:hypothetical protein
MAPSGKRDHLPITVRIRAGRMRSEPGPGMGGRLAQAQPLLGGWADGALRPGPSFPGRDGAARGASQRRGRQSGRTVRLTPTHVE